MIQLTPDRLAAVYGCLLAFPPFETWKLPPGDALGFHVSRTTLVHGGAYEDKGRLWIEVSQRGVSTWALLHAIVGHEMIHIKQKIDHLETPNTVHNADFMKRWRVVCARYGWDASLFV